MSNQKRRKASVLYNILKTTNFDNLKKPVIKLSMCGRKPVFSDIQELELKNNIFKACKLFYGLAE